MAAHQAPPSLGFSRQEYWSGCYFLLQCMKVKSESEVTQSCLTPSNPMDFSLSGSSIHGIFQARVLEWGAIAFSGGQVLLKTECRRPMFDPWVGKILWRRERLPTPVSWPGEFHGLYGPWAHKESDMTERLHFHFSLSCTGEGNGNPLQCPCLENPRDGGA